MVLFSSAALLAPRTTCFKNSKKRNGVLLFSSAALVAPRTTCFKNSKKWAACFKRRSLLVSRTAQIEGLKRRSLLVSKEKPLVSRIQRAACFKNRSKGCFFQEPLKGLPLRKKRNFCFRKQLTTND